jgi:hypothetical protein
LAKEAEMRQKTVLEEGGLSTEPRNGFAGSLKSLSLPCVCFMLRSQEDQFGDRCASNGCVERDARHQLF